MLKHDSKEAACSQMQQHKHTKTSMTHTTADARRAQRLRQI